MFYLFYELKLDKIDSLMNLLLLIAITLAIHKLLLENLDDEDKVKICCGYSLFSLFCGIIIWIYKNSHIKNKNSLNIITGISLILMSGSHLFYGLYYKENIFIFPNIFGILIGSGYIWFNNYLKNKYSTFQEIKGNNTVIDIENEQGEEKEKNVNDKNNIDDDKENDDNDEEKRLKKKGKRSNKK
jgi:hypothetical protein